MSPIYLRIQSGSRQEIQLALSAEIDGSSASLESSVTDLELEFIEELVDQLGDAGASIYAFEQLGRRLGSILFSGEVGAALRNLIERREGSALFLDIEGSSADWPWEVAIDPETGIRPALTIGMVRRGGRLTEGLVVPRQGLLVLPRSAGSARHKAVTASTRPLAKRHTLDLYSADPATGPGIREALEAGALVVHVEGVAGQYAILDDGQVPLQRLGLNDRVWLATLSGDVTTPAAMRGLLQSGAHAVVGCHYPIAAHQTSAFYRSFWQALASGDSISSAILRARFALAQLDGDSSPSWAAPIVYAAGDRRNEPALEAFPPRYCRDAGLKSLKLGVAEASESLNSRGRQARIGSPISAPVFVRNTLRRLMTGLASHQEKEERSEALLQLGGHSTLDQDPGGEPADRIQYLTDRFVDAIGQNDAPLDGCVDLRGTAESIAQRYGCDPEAVEHALLCLQSNRLVIFRDSTGRDGVTFAQSLAIDGYGYFPRTVHLSDGEDILLAPHQASDGSIERAGALYRSVATNWRRDELDPFQPSQAPPSTRMPTVARDLVGWSVFRGSWLVINNADALTTSALAALVDTLDSGTYSALEERGAYRLRIPKDFRVLLVSRWPTPGIPSGIPILAVDGYGAEGAAVENWLRGLNELIGIPEDQRDAMHRQRLARDVYAIISEIRMVLPVARKTCISMLAYAVHRGGMDAESIRQAVRANISGEMEFLAPETQDAIEAIISG